MPGRSERTVGRAGRTVAPGRAARRGAVAAAVVAAGAAVLAVLGWWHEADLRDLGSLTRTSATVQQYDSHRRTADQLGVQFRTAEGDESVTVPYSGGARVGDEVEIGYLAADPGRARTVEDWSPAYDTWLTYAILLAVLALALGAFGVVSGRRGGRWESDDPVGEAREEALGRRIVRGTRTGALVLLGAGVLMSAVLAGLSFARTEARVQLLLGAVALLAAFSAMAAGAHWWSGRDGVWATAEELVARRRSTVRRWPWSQVLELGMVVDRGSATVAAARLDDGLDDGIAEDGWVTLIRPSVGPLGAHVWATRFRALADEQGLPFTEGLTGSELADALGSTYRRRP